MIKITLVIYLTLSDVVVRVLVDHPFENLCRFQKFLVHLNVLVNLFLAQKLLDGLQQERGNWALVVV